MVLADMTFNIATQLRRHRGFTLIEMMIVVAIVAILATVAYPSYSTYIVRAKRSAAQTTLMTLVNRQQQYQLDARQYATTLAPLGTVPSDVAANYSVTLAADNTPTPPTYTLTATPTGNQQAADTKCGTLSIDQTGAKSISGTGTVATCW
jgi:type IV pilus assembly protein PilE